MSKSDQSNLHMYPLKWKELEKYSQQPSISHKGVAWAYPKEDTILVNFSGTWLEVSGIDWISKLLVNFDRRLEYILVLEQWMELGYKLFEHEVFYRFLDNSLGHNFVLE